MIAAILETPQKGGKWHGREAFSQLEAAKYQSIKALELLTHMWQSVSPIWYRSFEILMSNCPLLSS